MPLLKALDALTQALNVAGTLLIVALMVLIGADVTGRALFGAPLSGVPEIVTLSIVAIVFLQSPAALRAGRMTRSDGVIEALRRASPLAAALLETLFDLAAMAILFVLVKSTWPLFVRAYEKGDFIGAIGDFTAPTWPVKAVIVVGGTVLVLQFAARIVRRFLELER